MDGPNTSRRHSSANSSATRVDKLLSGRTSVIGGVAVAAGVEALPLTEGFGKRAIAREPDTAWKF